MGRKKKKDTAYRAAVSGAKGVLRILVYIFVILAIVFAGKTAYSFGYLVFDQHPMAETQEEGQDVTVIVNEEDSVYEIGRTLESKGLIERPVIFWMQEKLSDYRGKIKPGTYILNTYQNVDDMLAILSGDNTEGQSSQEVAEP
ncbi:MAG: solute-binding protein [Clostridia bacterium]|nr:solute-binding protein [Clostridia bacterium]